MEQKTRRWNYESELGAKGLVENLALDDGFRQCGRPAGVSRFASPCD